ncbi:MAG: Uncharacterised protein [Prochlorococcus marinus str. MIT 9313]|nr:MAG: Uncharacterised protein [Prochlorococcus marinus str. MIT 9313]
MLFKLIELIDGCIGNKRYAGAGEVEIIKTETKAADAFVGVEVETEVIGTTLPAQFDV